MYLYRIHNRAKLNLRILVYYARLCNVTIDSILSAGQNDDKNQDISGIRDAEILNILHQFSPDGQEKIIKILKSIKEIESETEKKGSVHDEFK